MNQGYSKQPGMKVHPDLQGSVPRCEARQLCVILKDGHYPDVTMLLEKNSNIKDYFNQLVWDAYNSHIKEGWGLRYIATHQGNMRRVGTTPYSETNCLSDNNGRKDASSVLHF